ncbi:hypothetical protein TDB9533_04265 [Thalassocella blandensis]|nr:hypothetical protein TDB9533_04265 [Thalassocella blandensis]
MNNSQCPCGGYLSHSDYASCCEPLHKGASQAATPEQLMRSRFSAFARQNAEYLTETLHPSQRNATTLSELQTSFEQARTHWLSLAIMDAPKASPLEGWVEFVAFYSDQEASAANRNVQQLHEKSRFVFEQQRWFYIDGEHLAPVKLGRNDLCWCGSGKKLKKCHS